MPVRLIIALLFASLAPLAQAETPRDVIGADLLAAATEARDAASGEIDNARYMTIIDYRLPSDQPRLFLIDRETDSVEALLVAHGRGSDTDHDGMAEQFSNIPNSKMTSLGAFMTGRTYYGKHGLSLKLHGLDPDNNNALSRAIVIHGADYVAPGRKLGRSWGCPALEQHEAKRVIPLIKGGSFLYVVGTPEAAEN